MRGGCIKTVLTASRESDASTLSCARTRSRALSLALALDGTQHRSTRAQARNLEVREQVDYPNYLYVVSYPSVSEAIIYPSWHRGPPATRVHWRPEGARAGVVEQQPVCSPYLHSSLVPSFPLALPLALSRTCALMHVFTCVCECARVTRASDLTRTRLAFSASKGLCAAGCGSSRITLDCSGILPSGKVSLRLRKLPREEAASGGISPPIVSPNHLDLPPGAD